MFKNIPKKYLVFTGLAIYFIVIFSALALIDYEEADDLILGADLVVVKKEIVYNDECVDLLEKNKSFDYTQEEWRQARGCIEEFIKPILDEKYIVDEKEYNNQKIEIEDVVKWHKQMSFDIGVEEKLDTDKNSFKLIKNLDINFVNNEIIKKQ